MLEGGRISLIESQEIRKHIIRYYDAVENLDKVSDKLMDIMLTNYYPTLLQHFDRVDDVVINPTFFKSPEFKNYFGFVFSEIRSQQFHAEIIQKEGMILRRLIEEYSTDVK